MDSRPNRRNKAAFSNSPGIVKTGRGSKSQLLVPENLLILQPIHNSQVKSAKSFNRLL